MLALFFVYSREFYHKGTSRKERYFSVKVNGASLKGETLISFSAFSLYKNEYRQNHKHRYETLTVNRRRTIFLFIIAVGGRISAEFFDCEVGQFVSVLIEVLVAHRAVLMPLNAIGLRCCRDFFHPSAEIVLG